MVARKEMAKGHGAVHAVTVRVSRAQTQRSADTLNRRLGLATPDPHPSAPEPTPSKVGIERHSPICQGFAVILVADNEGESHRRCTECDGVILPQLCCEPG